MKQWLVVLSLLATLGSNARALEWLTDVDAALARAQSEGKVVLLDFTGSDWCPWCIKLKSEVFDQFEFAPYAAANLVMVEVDFPRRKQISTAQLNANYALASKYHVEGYPTVIVLGADGRELGEAGYTPGGPKAFVARIEKFPGMPHKGGSVADAPADSPAPPATHAPAQAARPVPPAGPLQFPIMHSPQYGDLTLKGLSGTGNRRLALINNETLLAGESAHVKSFGTNIEVTVKEIRDASVVVVVQGQTRELTLARPPAKP